MSTFQKCPKCNSNSTYDDGTMLVCPDCGHEWSTNAKAESESQGDEALTVKDAYGNVLQNGDSITIIKDLKVKGASASLKAGIRVKNIRLVEGDHNIDCKIDGFGQMSLKSEFVKKA